KYLARRAVQQVSPAHHGRYSLGGVIYDDGKLIRWDLVPAQDEEVPYIARHVLAHRTGQVIYEGQTLVGSHDTQPGCFAGATLGVGERCILVAARPRVANVDFTRVRRADRCLHVGT